MNNKTSKDDFEIEDPDLGPSKSSLKREMKKLRELADRVSQLKFEKRAALNMPDNLALSIELATKLKSSNARNRQLRHSAKQLDGNEEVIERIEAYFAEQDSIASNSNLRHKQIEIWRDKLVDTNTDALSDFFTEFPNADRQELSTLVRNARKEAREKATQQQNSQKEQPPIQQRKLFKYLRDHVI